MAETGASAQINLQNLFNFGLNRRVSANKSTKFIKMADYDDIDIYKIYETLSE